LVFQAPEFCPVINSFVEATASTAKTFCNGLAMKHFKLKSSDIDEAVRQITQHVNPTHSLTISLVQALKINGPNGIGTWVRGDDVIYNETYTKFIRCLSKSIALPSVWKRKKINLGNAGSIEGGSDGERFHFHISVRKPEGMSEVAFVEAILKTAKGNPWIMNGQYAVKVVPIPSAQLQFGSVRYSAKRGLDRICIA